MLTLNHGQQDLLGNSVFDGSDHVLGYALNEHSMPAGSVEVESGPVWQNLLRQEGITTYLWQLARSRRHALHWFAPPCGMWTNFISRNTHKRGPNNLSGNTKLQAVVDANKLAEFVAYALLACFALGVWI
jgi:hypothetical protein